MKDIPADIERISLKLASESRGQIRSPRLGDVVDSGIGLSYRLDCLFNLAGWYDNPLPQSTISPRQGLRIWLQSELRRKHKFILEL
jgi:hypothetical protein